MNQAIGRVIRHKDDFGAILLCDTRQDIDSLESSLLFFYLVGIGWKEIGK